MKIFDSSLIFKEDHNFGSKEPKLNDQRYLCFFFCIQIHATDAWDPGLCLTVVLADPAITINTPCLCVCKIQAKKFNYELGRT